MVTTIRAITQQLDGFASEYATQLEHVYVDNRSLADEIRDALHGSPVGSSAPAPEHSQRPMQVAAAAGSRAGALAPVPGPAPKLAEPAFS
jgi:hypothetical protein